MKTLYIIATCLPFWAYLKYRLDPTTPDAIILLALFLWMIYGTDAIKSAA